MNGMKIARKLRDIQFKAPIIFLTAHADYAVESYEVYVAGYLLKPYDTNKLTLLLDEVLQSKFQINNKEKIKEVFKKELLLKLKNNIDILKLMILCMLKVINMY